MLELVAPKRDDDKATKRSQRNLLCVVYPKMLAGIGRVCVVPDERTQNTLILHTLFSMYSDRSSEKQNHDSMVQFTSIIVVHMKSQNKMPHKFKSTKKKKN